MLPQPLLNKIIVRPDPVPEERTAGGLYLPQQGQREAQTGTVVAVGSGHRLKDGTIQPLLVKPGDRIAFSYNIRKLVRSHFADLYETEDAEKVMFMPEEHVLAVLGKESLDNLDAISDTGSESFSEQPAAIR